MKVYRSRMVMEISIFVNTEEEDEEQSVRQKDERKDTFTQQKRVYKQEKHKQQEREALPPTLLRFLVRIDLLTIEYKSLIIQFNEEGHVAKCPHPDRTRQKITTAFT